MRLPLCRSSIRINPAQWNHEHSDRELFHPSWQAADREPVDGPSKLWMMAPMTDLDTQRMETEDQIQIAVIDETYGVIDDEAEWQTAREEFRRKLEAEHSVAFEDADIGPGASLPAFVTFLSGTAVVPIWSLLAAAFFLGKPLHENLKAWRSIAMKLREVLKRPAALNRQGAAVIAVEAVFSEMDGIPGELRLVSYGVRSVAEPDSPVSDVDIADAVPTLFLGFVQHVFRIEADGITFEVVVDGRNAKATRLA